MRIEVARICQTVCFTGGANAGPTTYDTGTVWVTVNGFQASASYGQGSTTSSVASTITNVFNTNSSSPVTASVSGSTISLTTRQAGAGTNYSLSSGSSTSDPGHFPQPSFSASVSGSTLTGGSDGSPGSLATPATTLYTYDVLDNLIRVEQRGNEPNSANWRIRTFAYNSLSQLTQAYNPESGTLNYTYDDDGVLRTKTDARGIAVTFTPDPLHRVLSKSYSDGTPVVTYGYDGNTPQGCSPTLSASNPVGRRTGMCDAAGWEAWSYDAMGRVLADRRTSNSATRDTTYSYNFMGSPTSITYPSGTTLTYAYDAAARPLSAVDSARGINYALSASYAPQGALASLVLGQIGSFTGINLNQGYNSRLQPTSIRAWSTSGTALDLGYSFNFGIANNGNVASITNNLNNDRTQFFTYDGLNRIATAKTQATTGPSAWGLQFGYDAWANLLAETVTQGSAPMLSQSVGTNNRLLGSSYDAAGNMLNDGSFSYSYDAENRMKTGAGVTYAYDGDGKRVQKSNGKLYWYGVGSAPLTETDLAGNNPVEYVFFGGQRIARRDSSGTISYYFADHLGSARVVTNATGQILDDTDLYPFGGERPVVSSSSNTYKFTGKERDTESGLDNFGARYNSSSLGRFMSPDPMGIMKQKLIDPQQWNKYTYVRNNPLRFLDPTGMYLCSDKKKCAEFEKARQEALKSKDANVVRAAKAYGDLGKDNGVVVSFADQLKGDRGGSVSRRGTGIEQDPDSPNGLRATVNVTIKSSNAGNEETLVHEGSHVADRQDYVNAIARDGSNLDQIKSLNITLRQSEIRAYELSIAYALRGNKSQDFGPCGVMQECKFTPGMMPALRDQLINDLLDSQYKNLDQVLFSEFPH